MPGQTPLLGLPYPLPADPVTDYPALGQSLATLLDGKIGLSPIWDSVVAGVTLPAASISTPAIPQTFRHLLIFGSNLRTAAALTSDYINVRCNGDAGNNYALQHFYANNTGLAGSGQYPVSSMISFGAGAVSAPLPASRGNGLVFIPGYRDVGPGGGSGYKHLLAYFSNIWNANVAHLSFNLEGGFYLGGAGPITALTFLANSGANITDGRFSIYGL